MNPLLVLWRGSFAFLALALVAVILPAGLLVAGSRAALAGVTHHRRSARARRRGWTARR